MIVLANAAQLVANRTPSNHHRTVRWTMTNPEVIEQPQNDGDSSSGNNAGGGTQEEDYCESVPLLAGRTELETMMRKIAREETEKFTSRQELETVRRDLFNTCQELIDNRNAEQKQLSLPAGMEPQEIPNDKKTPDDDRDEIAHLHQGTKTQTTSSKDTCLCNFSSHQK